MYFGTPLYWRETHKQPKFLIFDGRIVVIFLGVILHVRLWTILLAVAVMIVLFLFDRRGIPADSILRFLRSALVGRRRSARGLAEERPPVDFGFETQAMVARMAATPSTIPGPRKVKDKGRGSSPSPSASPSHPSGPGPGGKVTGVAGRAASDVPGET